LKPGEALYDLGSGDGRLIIAAARDFKAKAVGYEVAVLPYFVSYIRILINKLTPKVKVKFKNFYKENLGNAVYAVATVQEEIGLRGATTSAYGIDPRIGIAVDVTFASDHPHASKIRGDIRLGRGPSISIGPNISPAVHQAFMQRMNYVLILRRNQTLPPASVHQLSGRKTGDAVRKGAAPPERPARGRAVPSRTRLTVSFFCPCKTSTRRIY